MSEWLGDQMASLESIPQFYIVLIVSIVLCMFTEVTSNVATASIFLPIVGSVVGAVWGKVVRGCTTAPWLCGGRTVGWEVKYGTMVNSESVSKLVTTN